MQSADCIADTDVLDGPLIGVFISFSILQVSIIWDNQLHVKIEHIGNIDLAISDL